jgi:hypothetical protein
VKKILERNEERTPRKNMQKESDEREKENV